MAYKSEIIWYSIDEKTPVIPEGQYGMSLLIAACDEDFAECSDRDPCYISEVQYGYTRDRHGDKLSPWLNSDKESDFMEFIQGWYHDTEWVPYMDKILYWAYMPDHRILLLPR